MKTKKHQHQRNKHRTKILVLLECMKLFFYLGVIVNALEDDWIGVLFYILCTLGLISLKEAYKVAR